MILIISIPFNLTLFYILKYSNVRKFEVSNFLTVFTIFYPFFIWSIMILNCLNPINLSLLSIWKLKFLVFIVVILLIVIKLFIITLILWLSWFSVYFLFVIDISHFSHFFQFFVLITPFIIVSNRYPSVVSLLAKPLFPLQLEIVLLTRFIYCWLFMFFSSFFC